jgi:cullin 4
MGPKELSVSLYQGIILLLFNDAIELSFGDILEQTRISESYFSSFCLSNDYLMCDRRTRQSLACGKKRVLKKSPVGKGVYDNDVFRFHASFTDPWLKIHINSIQIKETVSSF